MKLIENEVYEVGECLPEKDPEYIIGTVSIDVIVWYKEDTKILFCAGYYNFGDMCWLESIEDGKIDNVAHWQKPVVP